MKWTACRVATGKEYLVRKKIKDVSPTAEILVPRRYTREIREGIVRTRSERMLPGYLLIGADEAIDDSVLKGYAKILGAVSEMEVANLVAQQGSRDDNLAVGISVLVVDGPFQGCKGKIQWYNEDGSMNCKLFFQTMEINADMKPELLSSVNVISSVQPSNSQSGKAA